MEYRNEDFINGQYNKPSRRPDIRRLMELARPKERAREFIPDKPSPYWLDYVLDETPRKITDPVALMEYYKGCQANLPRLPNLARPKTNFDMLLTYTSPKSMPASGIPVSALKYEPSERIRRLSTPRLQPALSEVSLPPITPETSASSTTRLPVKGMKYPYDPFTKKSGTSTSVDLGKGDFYNRSRHRMDARSSSLASTRVPSTNRGNRGPAHTNVQKRDNVKQFATQSAVNSHDKSKGPKGLFSETNLVGVGSQRLLVDRSYAASRTSLRCAEMPGSINNNNSKFTRRNQHPLRFAPNQIDCQEIQPPPENKRTKNSKKKSQ